MSAITLNLPDTLIKEAEANGLLKPETLAVILRDEIRRRRVNKLFATADRLAADDSSLTEAEIENEVSAHRAEKRIANARGS